MRNIDPRTKIIIVICISTLGVLIQDIYYLMGILAISLMVGKIFKSNVYMAFKKLKKMLYILIAIVIVQSIFMKQGNVLIGTESFKIITDEGLLKGLEFIMRILIIIISGTILATSNTREIIQGLVQWKLPYDLAFMVSIGIRFLPILMEEMKDTMTAISLRGIDVKALKIKEKIELYSYILTPVVVGTLTKAQKLSMSIESRAFRAYDTRTSIITLKFRTMDYLLMVISILLAVLVGYSFVIK
ncbi:energy-coupling factor transporter transmembrane component T family protein [Clostridium sp. DL1XJH146]